MVTGNFAFQEMIRIMKKILALTGLLLFLYIEGSLAVGLPVDSTGVRIIESKKFIEYKVEVHEGWFGIARKYGVSYGDLRIANKDVPDTLHIGQIILVPIEKINTAAKISDEEVKPVFYEVKPKETLYSIAKRYDVKADKIKEWNKLPSKDLNTGEKIIVGYKKVTIPAYEREVVKAEPKPEVKETIENPKSEVNMSIPETERGKNDTSAKKLPDEKLAFTKGRKEISEQGVATWIEDENINPNKYFALHRTAPPGTIIKVTNKMNRRSIFVKVVGKLPETGDNENVIIKISKASAEKLGVRDQRFQAELVYGVSN